MGTQPIRGGAGLEPGSVKMTPELQLCWRRGGAGRGVPRSDKGASGTPPGHLCIQKLGGALRHHPGNNGKLRPGEGRPSLETAWGAGVRALPPLGAPHLAPKQLGLRHPGALDLVAHAVEEGDTILVLVKTKELRQDLSRFLWKGRTNRPLRSSWLPTYSDPAPGRGVRNAPDACS